MSEPTRRDRTRPAELLGFAGVIAVAVGVITWFATRDLPTAGIFLGVAFIITVVVFAMLLLAVTPRGGRDAERDGDAPGGDQSR